MRQVLNGAVALLPFPDRADLEDIGSKAFSAYVFSSLLRTTDEVSPFFVASSLLLATRSPDELGRPSAHVHSTQFNWPNDEVTQSRHPELAKRFLSIYEQKDLPSDTLRQLGANALRRKQALENEIASIERRIDEAVYDLMAIDSESRKHFAEEIAFRQCLPPLDEEDDAEEGDEVEGESEGQSEEGDLGESTPEPASLNSGVWQTGSPQLTPSEIRVRIPHSSKRKSLAFLPTPSSWSSSVT